MRPLTIILIAVALLAGGGATFMAKRVVEMRARESAGEQAELVRDVDVLVAANTLPMGRRLREQDLRWDRWPTETVEATHVIARQEGRAALDHLKGRVLRRGVVAGEPLTEAAVFEPGEGGVMPELISPGKKAIGIVVNAATSASGFILPGDLVDVVLTLDLSRTTGSALPSGGRFVAETILQNVRVLAVDQSIEPTPSGRSTVRKSTSSASGKGGADGEGGESENIAMVGKTVALEVTSEQAERVLAAQVSGKLSLVLRSLAREPEIVARNGAPYVSDVEVSQALKSASAGKVRVIRAGQSSP